MRQSLRREMRFLRIYAITSSLILVFLCTAAFRQAATGKFDELTVGRINVVDANGALRLVLSNKDRMHPGMMDGKLIDRPRPVAGLLFFNEEGDEVGGLTFTGREVDGRGRANAGIMFDQYKQDQTIGISYSETDGRRTAGLQVWDRPDARLSELIEQLNAANKLTDPAARDKALATVRSSAQPSPRRLFAGKLPDRSATVSLSDAAGKPRLTLTVDADGNPRIEFLDGEGKVVSRMPQK
ncbi:MAG: hypothetical protein ABIP65_01660 [Vicinamibacterales bacterium]